MNNRLCADCEYLKGRMVGAVSSVYWCGKVGDVHQGTSIGVYPWLKKPHPKCPLKKEKNDERR